MSATLLLLCVRRAMIRGELIMPDTRVAVPADIALDLVDTGRLAFINEHDRDVANAARQQQIEQLTRQSPQASTWWQSIRRVAP
jgi:hypothetical protein